MTPHPRRRQLRQLRLHDRRLPRAARRRLRPSCATTPCRRPTRRPTTACSSHPARAPPRRPASRWTSSASAPRLATADVRRLPRPPGARRRRPARSSAGRPELLHGKTSLVHHDGTGVLEGLPSPFTATRYHSLDDRPGDPARRAHRPPAHRLGLVMGVRHRDLPLPACSSTPRRAHRGRSPDARELLALCGDAGAVARSVGLSPLVTAAV